MLDNNTPVAQDASAIDTHGMVPKGGARLIPRLAEISQRAKSSGV